MPCDAIATVRVTVANKLPTTVVLALLQKKGIRAQTYEYRPDTLTWGYDLSYDAGTGQVQGSNRREVEAIRQYLDQMAHVLLVKAIQAKGKASEMRRTENATVFKLKVRSK